MKEPMQDLMQTLMQDATLLTRSGQLHEATQLIQRALAGHAAPAGPGAAGGDALVIDGCVFEVDAPQAAASACDPVFAPLPPETWADSVETVDGGAGQFIAGAYSNAAGTRSYKLYVPPGHAGRALPLLVMLHGCTQNPDDFAAGTGMNALAREQGFYVLYPAQAQSANTSGCWNWFKHNHQGRGRGEPALLAGMTQAVMAERGIDRRRVYVAGLSAGAAMAAVLAQAYPDLFAAVGVHSGLPVGVARDMMSALAVMKDGPAPGAPGAPAVTAKQRTVPTIVFHGDRDTTVHPGNGEQVIAAALAEAATAQVEPGQAQRGRRYTRKVYRDGQGRAVAEHWTVHGSGHAWSGGQRAGSYTDPRGPDASAQMLRFFSEHPLPPSGA